MSSLDTQAAAVLARLPAHGVSADLLNTSTPGSLLQQLLAIFLPMLQNCIPPAKTADGLFAVGQLIGKRFNLRALGLRARIAQETGDFIVAKMGKGQDAIDMTAQLQSPVTTAIVEQFSSLDLPTCATLIAEQEAAATALAAATG